LLNASKSIKGSLVLDNILNFVIKLLPIAAGFMPATLYQLRFKQELSILYSISASLLIGYAWWWGLYDMDITRESVLMSALIVIGSYLLFRFDGKNK